MRRITALGYLAPCLILGAAAAASCAQGTSDDDPGTGGSSSASGVGLARSAVVEAAMVNSRENDENGWLKKARA